MRAKSGCACIGISCIVLAVQLSADTIVLRDGRRLQGQLIGIRDGVVQVDVPHGFFGHDRVQIDQDDISRIEFDENARRDQGLSSGGQDGNGGGAQSRPPGLRERSVTVNAAQAWQDTGVIVRNGQTVYFNASGKVRWGPNREDGPRGERNSPTNAARPMPNRPAASLIGRVGEGADYFFIGDDEGPMPMRAGGHLYLAINDDFLQDNAGAFRVTVFY